MRIVVDTIALCRWQSGCKLKEVESAIDNDMRGKVPFDDYVKEFLWQCIIAHDDIEIRVSFLLCFLMFGVIY